MGELRERPILMSGPMIRAILEGRKTQTRRVVKLPDAPMRLGTWEPSEIFGYPASVLWHTRTGKIVACPFGVPGDRLWVRETWCFAHPEYHDQAEGVRRGDRPVRDEMPWWCHYAATDDDVDEPKWSPSIHMPRWASRLTLRVTSVRVERVQDISEADARAEGVTPFPHDPEGDCWTDGKHRTAFEHLWGAINGWESWRDNPWVWAVGFEVERRAP